jgi:hypothetical protein
MFSCSGDVTVLSEPSGDFAKRVRPAVRIAV